MCSTALAHRGWLCKSTKRQKIGRSRLPISNVPTDVGFPDPFLIISAKADATKAERVSSRCHSASPPRLSVGDVPAETRSGAGPAGSTRSTSSRSRPRPLSRSQKYLAWSPGAQEQQSNIARF